MPVGREGFASERERLMARLNRTLILSYRIFVLSNTAGRGQCNAPDVEIAGDGSADGRRGRSRGAQEGTEPEGAVGRPALSQRRRRETRPSAHEFWGPRGRAARCWLPAV